MFIIHFLMPRIPEIRLKEKNLLWFHHRIYRESASWQLKTLVLWQMNIQSTKIKIITSLQPGKI